MPNMPCAERTKMNKTWILYAKGTWSSWRTHNKLKPVFLKQCDMTQKKATSTEEAQSKQLTVTLGPRKLTEAILVA